jgi:hypothetical protein
MNSKRIHIEPENLGKLEEVIDNNIRKLAVTSKYHLMVVWYEDTNVSARIVKRLREKGLKREDGFMMPYIIIGEISVVDMLELGVARNVFSYPMPERFNILDFMAKEYAKCLGQAYEEKAIPHHIIFMGDAGQYQDAKVPNYDITLYFVEPSANGYNEAKKIQANQFIDGIIIAHGGIDCYKLLSKAEEWGIVPLALSGSKKFVKGLGALTYDLDVYNTPEAVLCKYARDLEAVKRHILAPEVSVAPHVQEAKYESVLRPDETGRHHRSLTARFEETIRKFKPR